MINGFILWQQKINENISKKIRLTYFSIYKPFVPEITTYYRSLLLQGEQEEQLPQPPQPPHAT